MVTASRVLDVCLSQLRARQTFGFRGFAPGKSPRANSYRLIRSDGTDAKETLSEGERSFATFLYFYHLSNGSNDTSGVTTPRVVVFDDPVSGLDSDILFIVGSLIKKTFDDVRSCIGQIKQVFVLTHNVHFQQEVSFNPSRVNSALKDNLLDRS